MSSGKRLCSFLRLNRQESEDNGQHFRSHGTCECNVGRGGGPRVSFSHLRVLEEDEASKGFQYVHYTLSTSALHVCEKCTQRAADTVSADRQKYLPEPDGADIGESAQCNVVCALYPLLLVNAMY